MVVKKVFNNNVVLVETDGKSAVVIGKGIGFSKKPGDVLDEGKVEHTFYRTEATEEPLQAVGQISPQIIDLTNAVVKLAEAQLPIKFKAYSYSALADHLDFLIQRQSQHLNLDNEMVAWEVMKLYPKASRTAQAAVELIRKQMKCDVAASEAVFLTYHFVNTMADTNNVQTMVKLTQILHRVVQIIEAKLNAPLQRDTFNYSRFITHVRALLIRIMTHSHSDCNPALPLDENLTKLMVSRYPKLNSIVDAVAVYLNQALNYQLTSDERVYLILHLWRVTQREVVND